MRSIKKRDTKPELAVRSLLHKHGFRYRLHRKDLPGTPDIVFPSRKKVIFVHGCFWHGHDCSLGRRQPKRNKGYWMPKIARNQARDLEVRESLEELGWSTCVVWECETRETLQLLERLEAILGFFAETTPKTYY